jgi:hypothetical protein
MNANSLLGDLEAFAASYNAKLSEWRTKLAELRQAGRRAVVWGAGSKGVTFLNAVQAGEQIGMWST